MTRAILMTSLIAAAALSGCGDDAKNDTNAPRTYRGYHAFTLELGVSDNAENVKLIPNSNRAVLSSSKAKKATLLGIDGDNLVVLRSRALFPDDSSESELTNVDVGPSGDWAVFTRTLETRDPLSGEQTSCGGEIVFVDITDGDAFGTILKRVPVGPMPDSVDVSSDGRWVAVANERDGASFWGKCEADGFAPSISIVAIADGVALATERWRITMLEDEVEGREPETIAFARDSDLVACTLQDSHELALFRISALAGLAAPTSDDIQVLTLPDNSLGAQPWPDGVVAFTDGNDDELFAIAGEWNDTIIVVDGGGTVVANMEIDARDMPSELPRDVSGEAPPFRPDSLATFHYDGKSYLAASLKHSGAVGFWDVSDPAAPAFADVVKVGKEEAGSPTEPSTVGTEGVAVSPEGAFSVCANEGEGSVSLIRVSP